jgi:AmmeMemoRadiSam system protein B
VRAAWIYILAASLTFAATSCKKGVSERPAATERVAEKTVFKPPNVAGTFYPGDADELKAAVERLLEGADASIPADDVVAIITPHAGYQYSGAVAATAFRQLQGRRPATVVLVGPSHHCGSPGIATGTYDGYETPLGVALVDVELVAAVAEGCGDVTYSNVPFAREHCLEVQLPFVQTLFPEARIAPFIFCQHDAGAAARFGEALAKAVAAKDSDVVMVATCDLSHYHPYDEAVKLDRSFVESFERFDEAAIFVGQDTGEFEIDAPGVVAAAFWYGKAMGATEAAALEYKNSGDVTGDASGGVVGYVAAAVVE